PRPPRRPRLPYTTLFRSAPASVAGGRLAQLRRGNLIAIAIAYQHRLNWDVDVHVKVTDAKLADAALGNVALIQYTDNRQPMRPRSEEHTSELQSRENLVC